MGMEYNINSFTPYLPPAINFGGLYPYASQQNTETEAEKAERIKKEQDKKAAEEYLKRIEIFKQRAELAPKLEAQIKEIEDSKKELESTIDRAKKGKENEDGTIRANETWEEYNKIPTWKKALRAGSHFVQGTWKLATGFFGYETDEKTGESKWNWKKGFLNGAIAAGCGILCACTAPISLPLIGATTLGSAATGALLAVGAVCGVAGTYNGIKKAKKAIDNKNSKELDNAFQDIGAGVTIGVASALGARSFGASLEGTTAAGSVSQAARASENTFFKGVEFLTKEEYLKGGNAVSSFIKDATINAFRKIAQNGRQKRLSYQTEGLTKSWGDNILAALPKFGKSKFENSRYETTQSINKRLNEITEELNTPGLSQAKKAFLQNEEIFLNAQKAELRNTLTKDGWKSLRTESRSHNEIKDLKASVKELQSNGSTEINGITFNSSNENIAAMEQAIKRSKDLSKQIEQLSKLRASTIKRMAFVKKYASDVEAYTGKTRSSRIGRIYDSIKITKSDITWKKVLLSPFKALWDVTMIPFKPWNYVQKSPVSTYYKFKETIVPEYEAGFLTTGFLADAMNMGEKTLKTKIVSQNEKGEAVEQEVAVTKEVLSQLEEQQKQIDTALLNARTEYSKLFTA